MAARASSAALSPHARRATEIVTRRASEIVTRAFSTGRRATTGTIGHDTSGTVHGTVRKQSSIFGRFDRDGPDTLIGDLISLVN